VRDDEPVIIDGTKSNGGPSEPPYGCYLPVASCRLHFFESLLYFMLKCKAMTEATLSAKNQIVVPREAREALGLKPGDKILVVVRGEKVLVLQRPKSHRVAIRGLARGIYAANHIQKERRDWR
jgi:AbrB family looped-hinge helix DNA binding protein